jgi:hypothetical protein
MLLAPSLSHPLRQCGSSPKAEANMTSTKVAIRSIRLDSPFTKHPARQRYRVTLECGCSWWEDHDGLEGFPRKGQKVNCYAGHRPTAIASGAHAQRR